MALNAELFNIITSEDGDIVCHDCTFNEAIECFLQLIEMDKADGTYKDGLYKIVIKEKEPIDSFLNAEMNCLTGLYADFAGMAHGYIKAPKADPETCFYIGMICSMTHKESMFFIKYIMEHWNAYAHDVINGKYRYVLLTRMVYESWKEYEKGWA